MPAVTVDNILDLPAVDAQPEAQPRPLASLTDAPSGFEGEGFPVRRAFAGVRADVLDPFVHMDQMGEVEYQPGEPKGTPWHPHRGFETVTYMIDGTFQHRDSHGGGGLITNGDTQWMTAGSGILHIERPPEKLVASGGLFHGIQLWVNLPSADKWIPPKYQDLRAGDVGLARSPDGGALLRLIAGQLPTGSGVVSGPGSTHTPISMVHATVSPGGRLDLPWPAAFNALVYVLAGEGTVGAERRPVHTGQLAAFGRPAQGTAQGIGSTLRIEALAGDSRNPSLDVLVLGGQRIGEPVAHYGPFVMNTRAELMQAMEDFQKGRMGTIPADAPY